MKRKFKLQLSMKWISLISAGYLSFLWAFRQYRPEEILFSPQVAYSELGGILVLLSYSVLSIAMSTEESGYSRHIWNIPIGRYIVVRDVLRKKGEYIVQECVIGKKSNTARLKGKPFYLTIDQDQISKTSDVRQDVCCLVSENKLIPISNIQVAMKKESAHLYH